MKPTYTNLVIIILWVWLVLAVIKIFVLGITCDQGVCWSRFFDWLIPAITLFFFYNHKLSK